MTRLDTAASRHRIKSKNQTDPALDGIDIAFALILIQLGFMEHPLEYYLIIDWDEDNGVAIHF